MMKLDLNYDHERNIDVRERVSGLAKDLSQMQEALVRVFTALNYIRLRLASKLTGVLAGHSPRPQTYLSN